jgi:hypothetical protein
VATIKGVSTSSLIFFFSPGNFSHISSCPRFSEILHKVLAHKKEIFLVNIFGGRLIGWKMSAGVDGG